MGKRPEYAPTPTRVDTTLLTRDEEEALVVRWREKGDERARDALIVAHLPLVRRMAKRYAPFMPIEDVIQEGTVGLLKAVDKFEPGRGLRFATMASWWARASIAEALFKDATIRPCQSAKAKKAYFRGERAFHVLSVETPVSPRLTLGGTLIDQGRLPDELAEQAIDVSRGLSDLKAAMRRLTKRDRAILAARRLLDNPNTLDTLGKAYGVSKERIRQIEFAAIDALRQLMGVEVAG
jgi:RNA polymerase sigma-32 factor